MKNPILLTILLLAITLPTISKAQTTGEWAIGSDGSPLMIGQCVQDHIFVRDISLLQDNVITFVGGSTQIVEFWLDDDEIYTNAMVQALPPVPSPTGEPYKEITYYNAQFDIYLPLGMSLIEYKFPGEKRAVQYQAGDRMPYDANLSWSKMSDNKTIDGIEYSVYTLWIDNLDSDDGCHFSGNEDTYAANGNQALRKDDASLFRLAIQNENQDEPQGRIADMIIANQKFYIYEANNYWWHDPNKRVYVYGTGGNNVEQRFQLYNRVALYGSEGMPEGVLEVNGLYYSIINENSVCLYGHRNGIGGHLEIPSTVSFNGTIYSVTFIKNSAFVDCTDLTSVTIPNTVVYIGDNTFYNCSGLLSVTIGNSVTSIGSSAFNNCSGLTSITLPSSITSIGTSAFSRCSGLTSVTLPNSVTSIGIGTFSGCSGLTSINIPNSVISIGSSAFSGCSGLTSVTLPNSVTSIGSYAFSDCSGLTSVTLPNSVTSIETKTFYNCSGLTSVTLPKSITSISSEAFYGCSGLTVVTCHATTPPTIDSNSFSNDTYSQATLIVPRNCTNSYLAADSWNKFSTIIETLYDFESNGIYYVITDPNTVKVTYKNSNYNSYSLNVVVPDNVTYQGTTYQVTSIGEYAFYNSTGLTNVTIPNSVTSIGNSAFFNCTGLTTVTIPNSVASIGNYAFYGCSMLKTLNYNAATCSDFSSTTSCGPFNNLNITTINIGNGVRKIPAYFVSGLAQLTSITIPASVTSIGHNAFSGCSALTELYFNATSCSDFSTSSPFANTFIATIHVGDNVQRIPAYFAKGLTVLSNVIIGNSVTTIGNSAFYGCNRMTDITMGNSVTAINNSAFYGCTGLSTISLPSTMRTLSSKAFYNCNGLQFVTSYAENPPIMETSDCFTCYNYATLYVPYLSQNSYKNTYYWNNFYKIYGMDTNGNILATGITLNSTNKSLIVNQTFKLIATIAPDVATNNTVSWSSNNSDVAAVDSEGLVSAIADGTAIITATTTDGSNLSASCQVTVTSIPVTSVSLNKASLTLDMSDNYQLIATVGPNNATNSVLNWHSSRPAVATVSNDGLVTPISPGSTTITVTTTDGTNLSATCEVTIVRHVTGITLNLSSLTLTLPETAQLIADITPSDATNQLLNWTSSNTSVATVDGNGFITSVGVGTTTIKATTTDGTNLSATCQVTVNKQFVTSITLNENSQVMHIGDTLQLIANVQPENASYPSIIWSSGNSSVATVNNNGLVTAIAGGTTYIRASTTDGSYLNASCAIQVLPDYYIMLDTLSHIRGEGARVMDLPVSLVNKNPISGIQFDVSLPYGIEFNLVDGEQDVWLDDARGTRSHSISASQLSNGNYRILVTSSTSRDLRGNDGVLVHMNMLLPQQHDTGNRYINVSNIIASEADETRHTLDNKSTVVHLYYIVGDADANAIVDIADHAATASKILGKSPSPFYYNAANVDNNSSLDVVDLVGITNIALQIKPITVRQAPARGYVENFLYCDQLRLNGNDEAEINIGMDCGFDFAGFQMDVILPRGLNLLGATLGDEAARLGLAIETMPDGSIRILGTSFSDAEICGLCPKLITLRVKANRNYMPGSNLEFNEILFAERNLTSHYLDGASILYVDPSTVYELMDEARIYVENDNIIVETPVAGTVQIIAIDGRMIESQANVGRNVYAVAGSGIFIVQFNGKTIKVRI